MNRDQSGIYLVLTALSLFVLFSLIALAIGLGLIATDSTKLQHMSNVAALGAIKEFVDQRGLSSTVTPPTTAVDWANSARQRANAILAANNIRSAENVLDLLRLPYESPSPNSSGVIQPGAWIPGDPDLGGPQDPCDLSQNANAIHLEPPNKYPCLIPLDPRFPQPLPAPQINAMQLTIRNQDSNPIIAPFSEILGAGAQTVTVNATASLMQRCTAFVFDLSGSQTAETHYLPTSIMNNSGNQREWNFTDTDPTTSDWSTPPPNECFELNGQTQPTSNLPRRILCPEDSTPYAYRVSELVPGGTVTGWGPLSNRYGPGGLFHACDGINYSLFNDPLQYKEAVYWCYLATRNGALRDRPELNPQPHYRQDYLDVPGPPEVGLLRVDHYTDPEPFSSFLLGYNAALRLIRQQSTSGDQAVFLNITGRVRSSVPTTGTTSELDLLIQITNINNKKRITGFNFSTTPPTPIVDSSNEHHPNYIDAGLIPTFSSERLDGFTDISGGLRTAISRLQTNCPPLAQKSIILATDGIITCRDLPDGSVDCPDNRNYSVFTDATRQLLGDPLTGDPNPADPFEPVLRQLKDQEIILTVLLRGSAIGQNFKRIIAPDGLHEILTPNDAFALGHLPSHIIAGGYAGASSIADAYEHAGEPGVIFREPNLVLGRLALESGGIFCPIFDTCSNPPVDCPTCTTIEPGDSTLSCYKTNPDDPMGDRILRDCALYPNNPIPAPPAFSLRTCSVTEARTGSSTGAQAAYCSAKTVGGNPYIIVN